MYDTSRLQLEVFIEYIKHIQEVKRPAVGHRIQSIDSRTHSKFDPANLKYFLGPKRAQKNNSSSLLSPHKKRFK